MRYEKYFNKILFVKKILNTIRRHRVLISVVAAIAIVSTATFMGVQGIVYDNVPCPNEIQYGDTLSFEAKAVFGDVRYEYASKSAPDNWSENAPTIPGTYQVRAVSSSTFGTPRYGDVYTYSIVPRAIAVAVQQSQIIYGENPAVIAPLVYGDTISCDSFIYEDISLRQTKVAANKESIVIKDTSGNDVTSYYNIATEQSDLLFIPRKVTVTVSSASAVYNGIPLSFDGFELTDGNMAYTDTLYPVINTSITDVGKVENIADSWLVINSDNVDVTLHYEINQIAGELSVDKRPLVIETGGASFVYDGTNKDYKEFSVIEGGDNQGLSLVDGHKVTVNSATSMINVGSTQNLLTFGVLDAQGKDVTSNYTIFVTNPKIIEVTKRPVTLTTGNYSGIYDDQYHTNETYNISEMGIANGQAPVYSNASKIINVGEEQNKVTLDIIDANGKNVTSNYEINYIYGTLKVEPLVINVATSSAEKTYDGNPLVSQEYTITSELISGHSHSYLSSSSVTDVLVDENGNITDALNMVNITILNASGTDVTNNYSLNYGENNANLGKLKVLPREITISTHSKTFVYDGLSHSFLDYTAEGEEAKGFNIEEGELVEGHSLYGVAEGSASVQYVSQGDVQNIIDIGIIDSEGNPVSANNYTIICPEENIGTLKIEPLALKVTTNKNTFVYDGLAHSGDSYSLTEGVLPEGHEFFIIDATEVINVDDPITNEIELGITFEEAVVDASNYRIAYNYEGTIEITPRPITVITNSAEFTYDATPHSDNGFVISEDTPLVSGHVASINGEFREFTNVNETIDGNNVFYISIQDENGTGISYNYNILYQHGTITINPRPVTVITNSKEFIYDATPHSDNGFVISEDTPLVSGHVASINGKSPEFTNVRETREENNVFAISILGENDSSVIENYAITYSYGTITIKPRDMTVETSTDDWTYDGNPHSNVNFVVSDGLNEGFDYSSFNQIAQVNEDSITFVTNVWESGENKFDVEFFLDGNDITDNYNITYVEGTLTINQKPITVQTATDTWTYDGAAHSNIGFEVFDESGIFDYAALGQSAVVDENTTDTVTDTWDSGEGNNQFTITITHPDDDPDGHKVMENYDISYIHGSLKIDPRPISIITNTTSWIYDGCWHSDEGYTYEQGSLELVDGHRIIFDSNYTQGVKYYSDNHTVNSLRLQGILDSSDNDMSANYVIPTEENGQITYGEIWIEKRDIKIVTTSKTFVYSDEAHSAPSWTVENTAENEGLAHCDEIVAFDNPPSITDVGEIDNDCVYGIYCTDDSIDVSESYNITMNIGTIRVIPRTLYVHTGSGSWVYDGISHYSETFNIASGDNVNNFDIVDGHRLICTSHTQVTDVTSGTDNKLEFIVMKGTDNKTNNYEIIITEYGKLVITPREITVNTYNGEWTYDGQTHFNTGYDIINSANYDDGALAPEQYDEIDYSKNIASVENTWDTKDNNNVFAIKIVDAYGRAKTDNYAITYNYGKLTIKPKPITVTTLDHSWIYDGKSHSYPEFTLDSSLKEFLADLMQAAKEDSDKEISKITNTWETKPQNNVFEIKIVGDRGETDMTDNYDITYVYGNLEITQRNIEVETFDGAWVYDGIAHSNTGLDEENGGFSIGGDGIGEHLYYKMTPTSSITNVFDSPVENTIDIVLYLDSGLTDPVDQRNYNIDYVSNGELSITQRHIELVTYDGEWVYDGLAHGNSGLNQQNGGYALLGDGLGNYLYFKIVKESTIKNVGTVANAIEVKLYLDTACTDSNKVDERNYEISTVAVGTLTITHRPITITAASDEKIYDDKPFVNKNYTEKNLVSFHTIYSIVITSSDSVDVGEYDNVPSNAIIHDENGEDVTFNYDITYENGKLTILPREFHIQTKSGEWVYDAQPHSLPEYEYLPTTPNAIVEGHKIEFAKPYPSITDYVEGGIPNSLVIDSIVAPDGRNVTHNYILPTIEKDTLRYGTLLITRRPISIKTGSEEWIYDGQSHTNDKFEILNSPDAELEGLVKGQSISVNEETLTYIKDVGSVDNVFKILIFSADDRDVTFNYEITYTYGTLKINPRPILVKTGSEEWTYDGYEHYNEDFTVEANEPQYYPLVSGHNAIVTEHTVVLEVKDSKYNTLTVEIFEGEDNVTENYVIEYDKGYLEIIPRPITITSASDQKFYDGKPLTNKDFTVGGLGLADNQIVSSVDITGSQTIPGESENTINNAKIQDAKSKEVTENYDITYVAGTLVVLTAEVEVKFDDKEFTYNGNDQMWPFASIFNGDTEIDGFTVTYKDIDDVPTVREVGDEADNIFEIVIKDKNGTDVTDYFKIIEKIPGKLTVVEDDGDDDGGEGGGESGGEGEGGGTGGNLDISGDLGGTLGSGSGDGEPSVVMKIKSTVSGSIYLRLISFGEYTGQGWSEAPKYEILIDEKYSYNFLTGSTLALNGYTAYTLEIESFTDQYFLPYYMAMLDGEYTYPMPDNDVIFDNSHDGTYTVPYYLYTGYGIDLNNKQDTEAEKAYAAFVMANYLNIGREDTEEYLLSIIEENNWSKDDPDIIAKVAEYVQNAAVYNLDYNPELDEAEDAVVAFLRDYKEGVCRHYASAATLIYRALGIPARYTGGYVGSTKANEWTEITSDSGHAWVEVYIDGVGWIMVEVTGTGFGDGTGEGDSGDIDIDGGEDYKPDLLIRPQYQSKSYDGTPLYAVNQLDENEIALRDLLAQGYTYEVEISGSQTEVGTGISTIESFTLYDPRGVDVTDQYNIIKRDGELEVFAAQNKLIVYVWELSKTYDGKPISYPTDFEYFTILDLVSTNPNASLGDYTIELTISGQRTEVGILPLEEITYTLVVKDNNNNYQDVSDQFYVEFTGTPLTVNKRKITLTSASQEMPFDKDKPLFNQNVYLSFGSLADGHRLQAEASGVLYEKGSTENIIFDSNIIIIDSKGNDVTANYDITKELGTLTYY